MIQPTEAQIDAGGKVLRNMQMVSRVTKPWEKIRPSEKRVWRDYASAVIQAALNLEAVK